MSILKDIIAKRLGEGDANLPSDDEARSRWPNLWEFMTHTDAGDNKLKEPARITLSLGLGEWMIDLADQSLGVGLSAASATLQDAFDRLEKAMTAPNAPWRVWRGKDAIFKDKPKKKNG